MTPKREAWLYCTLTDQQLADPQTREQKKVPFACRSHISQWCCYACPNSTLLVPRDGSHIAIVPDSADLSDIEERGNPYSLNLGC